MFRLAQLDPLHRLAQHHQPGLVADAESVFDLGEHLAQLRRQAVQDVQASKQLLRLSRHLGVLVESRLLKLLLSGLSKILELEETVLAVDFLLGTEMTDQLADLRRRRIFLLKHFHYMSKPADAEAIARQAGETEEERCKELRKTM